MSGAAAPSLGEPGLSAWERIHARIIAYGKETERIVLAHGAQGHFRILDLACGTGRHLIEAARLGHQCAGIDEQEWKIERARQDCAALGLAIDFSCGDIRTADVEPVFDIAICLYALSTMTADADVHAVFRTARRALRPDGSFIFNVLNKKAATGPSPRSGPGANSPPGHLREFDENEILGFSRQAGFTSHEVQFFDIAGVKERDMFIHARPRGR
jgi:SAM-dependent methyltransferase